MRLKKSSLGIVLFLGPLFRGSGDLWSLIRELCMGMNACVCVVITKPQMTKLNASLPSHSNHKPEIGSFDHTPQTNATTMPGMLGGWTHSGMMNKQTHIQFTSNRTDDM